MKAKNVSCDIVILGTGLSGTILGAILAKNHLNVILIDKDSHPRFTIGESTIATTTQMLEFLAVRYDVPELNHLTSISQVSENVQPSCGVKRNFGFVYHRENAPQNPQEINQALVVNELHYFRQDTDAYMLHVAIRYGCKVYQNTTVEDVQISDQGVEIQTQKGLKIHADYVVDGSGYKSILADMFGLRETPTRTKTHSRGLFTHMIDVKPFDECLSRSEDKRPPVPWHQGTLHHIFDGGWMWVIPFNNTPESKNQLISVGLMLDPRKFPKPDVDPETEFFDFLKKYPDIAKQFKQARSVREWVSSGRIQYSSQQCLGDRFCLLSHATGFIDPLFSRGLFNTMQTINVLANLLLKASNDKNFSKTRFQPLEEVQQGLIDYNDQLVHCSYISFRNYLLWNAWFRLWLLTGAYGQMRLQRATLKYKETRDPRFLDALDEALPGAFTTQKEIMDIFQRAVRCVEQVDEGVLSEEDAEKHIFSLLEEHKSLLPPFFDYLSPAERITRPHPPEKIKALVTDWVNHTVPESFKNEYFDYPLELLFEQAVVKDTIVAPEK